MREWKREGGSEGGREGRREARRKVDSGEGEERESDRENLPGKQTRLLFTLGTGRVCFSCGVGGGVDVM